MPAVVIDTDFIEKLEEDVGAFEGVVDRVRLIVPRHKGGGTSERIGEAVAHHMPVGGGKAAVVLHRLPCDHLLRVVLFEGEGIFGFWPFVLDLWDIGKERHEFV